MKTPPPAPRTRRRWTGALPGRRLAALLVLALTLAVAAGWLLNSEAGLRWAAARLAAASDGALRVEQPAGRLLGPLRAAGAHLRLASGHELELRGLRLDWRPGALLAGRLEITSLVIDTLELRLPNDSTSPAPPDNLRLPLALVVDALQIGQLRQRSPAGGDTNDGNDGDGGRTSSLLAGALHARLESDGQRHRIDALRATLPAGMLAASARLDGTAPFALAGQAVLDTSGEVAARVRVDADGTLAAIDLRFTASGEALRAGGTARLTPFAAWPLDALQIEGDDLDPREFLNDAPHARLSLTADLRGMPGGGLDGPVRLRNTAAAPLDRGGLPLDALDGRLTLASGALRLDDLVASLAGGDMRGTLDLHWPPPGPSLPLPAALARLSGHANLALRGIDPAAAHGALRPLRLSGRLRLAGDSARQTATLALSDGTLRAEARLTRSGEQLTLDDLRLQHGEARLEGSGDVALTGAHPFRFSGRLRRFDLATLLAAPPSRIDARLEASGTLTPTPAGRLRFDADDSRLAGQRLDGHGDLTLGPGLRAAGTLELRLADSRLRLAGAWGESGDTLRATLEAPALARHGHGLAGALEFSATLGGRPTRPDIDARLRARDLTLPGGHRLARLDARVRLQDDMVDLELAAADYRQGDALRLARLRLDAEGLRQQHRLRLDARLADGPDVTASVQGGFLDPPVDWRASAWQGTLATLRMQGSLPAELQAPAPLAIDRAGVHLGPARLAFADGRIEFHTSEWTPRSWRSTGRFTGIALRPGGLGGTESGNEEGSGGSTGPRALDTAGLLRLGGEWSLAVGERIDGHFTVHRESGDWTLPGYVPRPLGLQALRIEARTRDSSVEATLVAHGSRLGDWEASARVPLARDRGDWRIVPLAPLAGRLRAQVPDLSWVGPAIDGNLTSSGRLEIDGELAGTLQQPRTRGHLRGSGLALGWLDQNVSLRQGTLDARFEQERIRLERLEFSAPHAPPARAARIAGLSAAQAPGRLLLQGSLDLAARSGRLEATLERLPLAQRPERWIVASGRGQADFAGDLLSLGARIVADAGFIAQAGAGQPQLADDVVIVGRDAAPRRALRIDSEIALDLGERFHLRAGGLEARLGGQLRLRGEPSRPLRASGMIATHDGVFEAYGQRLTVERGIVNFQGPLDDPGLNVLAVRKGLSVEAGVAVSGTVQRPVVRLVSTPAVPDPEKLSWIVLGRVPDAGGTDASLLLTAAGAILGGQADGLTGQLAQALGVDELALRQAREGDPLTSQILTVGKRLSARAFLSYEQGLSATAGAMKLSYALTPRVSLVTRAGADNALDLFYTFSFD